MRIIKDGHAELRDVGINKRKTTFGYLHLKFMKMVNTVAHLTGKYKKKTVPVANQLNFLNINFFLFLFVAAAVHGWGLNTSRSTSLYISPNNDTILLFDSQLCSEPLLLLIIVCSAPNNTLERAVIRETWGNFSSPSYKVAFLLGITENSTLQVRMIKIKLQILLFKLR